MSLSGKHVLITAGPTWVPIDEVRVISNISTGATGRLLAEKLSKAGAKVTLLLGPAGACCLDKNIKLRRFTFFEELKKGLFAELKSGRYAAVLHCAAVSDYRPESPFRGKIKSGAGSLIVRLSPTEKIIDGIKRISPGIFLVGFKFFPRHLSPGKLFKDTRLLMKRSGADAAVVNTFDKNSYRAYLLGTEGPGGPFFSKAAMVEGLIKYLSKNLPMSQKALKIK